MSREIKAFRFHRRQIGDIYERIRHRREQISQLEHRFRVDRYIPEEYETLAKLKKEVEWLSKIHDVFVKNPIPEVISIIPPELDYYYKNPKAEVVGHSSNVGVPSNDYTTEPTKKLSEEVMEIFTEDEVTIKIVEL